MAEEVSVDYSHCPNVFSGGKQDCSDGDCKCFDEGETGCIFGICICTWKSDLIFGDQIKCNDKIHRHIYENITYSEHQCPRTCLALDQSNTCFPPTQKGVDGQCYCPDGSPVVPIFTTDSHGPQLDPTASLEICSRGNVTITPVPPVVSNKMMYLSYIIL